MKAVNAKREFVVPLEKRITDSAHASTLLKMKDGSVLAAWFGGSWEKDPNVNIYMARRGIDGLWQEPYEIAGFTEEAAWNPVLFRCPDDSVMLFFKSGAEIPEWKTYYRRSYDEGLTWTDSEELVPGDTSGGRGPVKDKPILLSDGKTILAPASMESPNTFDSFVDISTDNGKTWKKSKTIPIRHVKFIPSMVDQPYSKYRCFGLGVIQPTLWEDSGGVIHAFMRSTSSAIFTSVSHDKGESWELAYDSGLPNNNSGIDLVRTENGFLYLCYNPNENLPCYTRGSRTPLVIDFSKDNGLTWERLITLESEEGEYSYPAIIADGNDKLMVTYTYKRETICFWQINLSL